MSYIIVDLEATCWVKNSYPERMEIIEIGAVRLETATGPAQDEFARFVRPIAEPILSDFCQQLTSIRQAEVDAAADFKTILPEFLEWIGSELFTLCSWGAYDLGQFRIDCRRHGLPFPAAFERHLNLKKEFAALKGIKPCGMARALALLGLPLEGQHHRAIVDARNIARIAQVVLPAIESGE